MPRFRSCDGPRISEGVESLRVLFLPKNSRTGYFQSLLAAARTKLNWQIDAVCPDSERQVWRDAVNSHDAFHLLPQFSERQAWEDDPGRVAEIDALIGECERANGVSAARIILTGERDIGRGFSRSYYYWFHNKIARRVLADNNEPFRVVRRIFAFARETLDASRPDLVLAGEWADPVCFTFYLVARSWGSAASSIAPPRFGAAAATGRKISVGTIWRRATASRHEIVECACQRARERIASFRSAPTTLGYVRQNWDADERRRWLVSHG